jgi:hypothetical protein
MFRAPSTKAPVEPPSEDLYEEAKQEGALVLYGSSPTSLYEVPARAFEQKYPGIKVTIHAGFSNVCVMNGFTAARVCPCGTLQPALPVGSVATGADGRLGHVRRKSA